MESKITIGTTVISEISTKTVRGRIGEVIGIIRTSGGLRYYSILFEDSPLHPVTITEREFIPILYNKNDIVKLVDMKGCVFSGKKCKILGYDKVANGDDNYRIVYSVEFLDHDINYAPNRIFISIDQDMIERKVNGEKK